MLSANPVLGRNLISTHSLTLPILGDSCGIHMLNENVKRVSLQKLAVMREEIEGKIDLSFEEAIEVYIVEPFDRYYKPETDWDKLRNPHLCHGMHFLFPGLKRTTHRAVGCERDRYFTLMG
jgi:hypothetical protein